MKSRRLKIVLLACVGLVLLAGGLCAVLPQLLEGVIRNQTIAQLNRDWNRPVEVGMVEVSWEQGVIISELVIHDQPGFGPGVLFCAESVQFPFRPWQLMTVGPRFVTMNRAVLNVVLTETDHNLRDLPPFEMRRLAVQDATVNVKTRFEDRTEQTTFEFTGAVFEKDLDHGGLRWEIKPAADLLPRLATQGQWGRYEADGDEARAPLVELRLEGMQLGGLRAGHFARRLADEQGGWPSLPSGPLTGRMDVAIKAEVDEAAQVEGTGRVEFSEVAWAGEGAAAVRFDKLTARFLGGFDLASQIAHVKSLSVAGPGLDLEASGRFAEHTNLAVRVAALDPDRLAEACRLPAVEAVRPWLGKGILALALDLSADSRSVSADLSLDADDWELTYGQVHKTAGEPLRLAAQGTFNRRTGRLEISPATLTSVFGDASGRVLIENWDAVGETLALVEQNPGDPLAVVRDFIALEPGLELTGTADLADLARLEPIVADLLGPGHKPQLAGPAHLSVHLHDEEPNLHIATSVAFPSATHLRLTGRGVVLLEKPLGQTLHMRLDGALDASAAAVRQGQLHLATENATTTLAVESLDWAPKGQTLRRVNAHMQVDDLGAWLALLPAARDQQDWVGLALDGSVTGSLAYERDPQGLDQGHARLDLTETVIQLDAPDPDVSAPLLQKPTGAPTVLVLELERPDIGSSQLRLTAETEPLTAELTGRLTVPTQANDKTARARLQELAWSLQVRDLAELAEALPGVLSPQASQQLRLARANGEATCRGRIEFEPGFVDVEAGLDAGAAGFELLAGPDAVLWRKSADEPLEVRTDLEIDYANGLLSAMGNGGSYTADVRLQELAWTAGPLTGRLSGRFTTDSLPGVTKSPHLEQFLNGRVHLYTMLCHDARRLASFPLLAEWVRRVEPAGQSELHCTLAWNQPEQSWTAAVEILLTAAGFNMPLSADPAGSPIARKPPGTLLTVTSRINQREQHLGVEELTLVLAGNQLAVTGAVTEPRLAAWLMGREPAPGTEGAFAWQLDAPEVAALAELIPSLKQADISGNAQAQVHTLVQLDPTFTLYFEPSQLDARLAARLGNEPVRVAIEDLQFSAAGLMLPRGELVVGDNQITLVADLQELPLTPQDWALGLHRPRGQVHVLGERLDLDEMEAWLQRLVPMAAAQPADSAELDGNDLATLVNWDIRGRFDLAHLLFTDPASGARLDLAPLRGDYHLVDALGRLQLAAGLSGGSVELDVRCNLAQETPLVQYDQVARDLQPSPSVSQLVESEFPGLKVAGPVSEKKSFSAKLVELFSKKVAWQGAGVTQCENGTLYGPGAPEWIIKMFPGLRLVEYPFEKMTNQFTLQPGGAKENDMLFIGETYDIYITGASRPVEDPALRARVMELMATDLQNTRALLEQVEAGKRDFSTAKVEILRERLSDLEVYLARYASGENFDVTEADYVIGSLLTKASRERFEIPNDILRLPLFSTHSYIVGLQMIGLTMQSYLSEAISR